MSKFSFEHIINMINHQRHDWLNHIQVLHGLLKLESYEKMQNYLEKITFQLQLDQYISQLRNTELILYIHTFPARNSVMAFEVEIAEIIHLDEYKITSDHIHLLLELLDHFAQNSVIENDVLPSLLLTMGKLESKVQFTLDFVGRLDEQMAPKWNRISKELIELGTTIHSKEKGENEWLLEIIMG